MKNYRKLLVCIPLFALPFLLSNLPLSPKEEAKRFHTPEETVTFAAMVLDTSLPTGYNSLFAGSGVCIKCHGYDTLGLASVGPGGIDVNVVSDWRATMMGNSAKDPFWRAKVSHEVLLYPMHKNSIEDKCTSCHAPLGHFNAKHTGLPHYLMDSLANDPLGKDGVSCVACHQQAAQGLGFAFSGIVNYDTFKVAYGQYPAPLVSPMLTETGYKPKYSPHIEDAGQCAGCHTLITETLDFEGNITGDKFVEQATYHEWLNSSYNGITSCQHCHMPGVEKFYAPIVTGSQTEKRSPFYLHEFVGGNVTMLKLLKENIAALEVKASASQFDEVIGKTMNMLQNRSLSLSLEMLERDVDTARFALKLINKAGHKLPSGYPSRRMFIEFLVKNDAGDTLFISGKTDNHYEVFGQNPDYEPHYQTITSEEQVQIYELVMGDVNGDVTTVLERAKFPIKDNRLPPNGFSTTHSTYDTTLIAGEALNDLDFNKENGVEGSGTDVVNYYIPLNGNLEHLSISAKVFYQSTPPKWMKEMFDHNTAEIDAFRTMFEAADRTPVLMKEISIEAPPLVAVRDVKQQNSFIKIYPSPATGGRIFIQSSRKHDLRVYDLEGRLVSSFYKKSGNYELDLKGKGVFLFRFDAENGARQIEKVVIP